MYAMYAVYEFYLTSSMGHGGRWGGEGGGERPRVGKAHW